MLKDFAAMDKSSCAVSIVAPCFNEEDGLEEFHRRTALACHAAVGSDYEIVLVDDGSHDRSWEIMCGHLQQNPQTSPCGFCTTMDISLPRRQGFRLRVGAV